MKNRLALRIEGSSLGISIGEEVSKRRIVILDAGHGGEDGGTSATDGTPEKDLNLTIAKALADYLRAGGVEVILTRDSDRLLYDPESDHEGRKKMLDFAARLKTASDLQETNPDAEILFISIHMNAYPDERVSGLQVWYASGDETARVLADTVQSTIRDVLHPENHRKTKAAGSNIYLLDRLTVPAILIECGFLSNPVEAARLQDPTYQRKLAFTLSHAILSMQTASVTSPA